MKSYLVFLLFILTYCNLTAQKKIKKLDIKEEGVIVKRTYQPVLDVIEYNGLKIRITPISPDEVNDKFNRDSQINGKSSYSFYNKSRESYFLKKQKKNKEKSDYQFLTEGLDWLIENDKINLDEYNELSSNILADLVPDFEGSTTNLDIETEANPYFIGNIYMNVFQIEFLNPSSNTITFNEAIYIRTGYNTFNRLSSEFLQDELEKSKKNNAKRSQILERYNLNQTLILHPNTKTIKYFAVLPLEIDDGILEAYISNSKARFSWNVNETRTVIDRHFSFYEFSINYFNSSDTQLSGPHYNILSRNSRSFAYLGDNRIFIVEDQKDREIEIITLSISADQLYFSRESNIKASSLLDTSKNRRSAISISSERITEVKKKN